MYEIHLIHVQIHNGYEMGYNQGVSNKAKNIRDFWVSVFFVGGSKAYHLDFYLIYVRDFHILLLAPPSGTICTKDDIT